MKIIRPSVEFFGEVPTDYENALKFIEKAGRVCYKSEDKITPTSAEGFVRKLIKAGHLAMVEHSNFVVRALQEIDVSAQEFECLDVGKFLHKYEDEKCYYVGGNLTAWVTQGVWTEYPALCQPFVEVFGSLFDMHRWRTPQNIWEICPHNEIPKELHRYSAKFVCDRGVSHELVRHRPCSFAQESTRYVNYGGKDMEFIEPTGVDEWSFTHLKLFHDACAAAEEAYGKLLKPGGFTKGLTPQQARAVLPNALKTEIVVMADAQEWAHIFKLRCAPSAHPDFRRLAIPLRDKFIEEGIL